MARNYVGTVFAPEGDDLRLLDVESWPEYVSYVVYQRELCPDTAREHFQIYIELSEKKSIVQLRDACDGLENSWLQQRRGSQKQALAYCKKEDTRIEGPWEHGVAKAQGQRVDLEAVKTDIDKGYSMKRVADEHFHTWARYHNAFRVYKRMRDVQRDWPMEIYLILGPSGTGKTKFARDSFPNAYWKPHGKWWDNYDGQDAVVVDEMYGNRFSFTELLNLMDRYPHSVECKGTDGIKRGLFGVIYEAPQAPRSSSPPVCSFLPAIRSRKTGMIRSVLTKTCAGRTILLNAAWMSLPRSYTWGELIAARNLLSLNPW